MNEIPSGTGSAVTLSEVSTAFMRTLGFDDPKACHSPTDASDRLVADRFAPPSVVLDPAFEPRRCYNMHGPPGRGRRPMLKFGSGDGASWRQDLESTVTQCCADGMARELPPCNATFRAKRVILSVSVTPFEDSAAGETLALVAFAFPSGLDPRLEHMQRALREQSAFLEAVVENIPNMIFIKEADELRFVRINRAGEELLGISREEMLGKNDFDFFPEAEAEFFTSKDRGVLESGEPVDIPEEPIHTAQHGTRYLHTKKVPLVDEETGEPAYLLGISEDITASREMVEAIEAARVAAEQANVAKSQFLANMSHELRTPLTAILGYTELLLEDAPSPGIERDLRRIWESSRHLLGVISSVLDLSKIESGTEELALEECDLRALVEEVVVTVQPLFAHAGNKLDVEIDQRVGAITADPTRLRQCVINVVANACKFTDHGTVTLRVAASAEPGRFLITVRDEGIGMTAPELARAFEPFYQADSSPRRRYRGTGLGLSITRSFVEMMQGHIRAESEPRAGTVVTMDLPVHASLVSAS